MYLIKLYYFFYYRNLVKYTYILYFVYFFCYVHASFICVYIVCIYVFVIFPVHWTLQTYCTLTCRADPPYTQNTQAAWPRNTRGPVALISFQLWFLNLASGYENMNDNYIVMRCCRLFYVKKDSFLSAFRERDSIRSEIRTNAFHS